MSANDLHLLPRSYFFVIRLYKNNEQIQFLKWEGNTAQFVQKWRWYFNYRAALLQVQNPRLRVETDWGSVPAQGKDLVRALKNSIAAKRGKITSLTNAIGKYRQNWNSLFPIEEDPQYIFNLQKLEERRRGLALLEEELNELQKTK